MAEPFSGRPNILGKKILLDRKPYVVIGVMPRNFEFPLLPGHLNRSELWVPISFTTQELAPTSGANWSYSMVGRLKPGVTAAQAVSDAESVAKETMRNYPAFMAGLGIRPVVRPLHEETVEQARPMVRTLFLAVAVVLLIACANLAGLAAGASYSEPAGDSGSPRAGSERQGAALADDDGEPGVERCWRRGGTRLRVDCTACRRQAAAGDTAARQRDRPGLAR